MAFLASSASVGQPSAGDSPFRISDHELIRLIGSGAYGEVWLAQNIVGTLRAVKIVRRDRHESTNSFEREFKGLQKFEPVSRAHEGLADILTLGLLTDGAGFYYVMELADNASETGETSNPLEYAARTLRAELKRRSSLPAEEVITLGVKLATAIAYLHAQGLVHRDVKPSNVLFIGDEPKLADAGLVAAIDDARSLVGTAGYIAPEGPGTPQADIYALGKVLYEAAFGRDRQEFPTLPADVASRSDHSRLLELNEVITTACAPNPNQRYASAQTMLNDLEALDSGHSIRRQRRREQRWKTTARIIIVTLSVIITLGATFGLLKLTRERPISANPEALNLYTQAKHLLNQQTLDRHLEAHRYLAHAVKRDPRLIDAYYLMWESYSGGWGDRLPPYTNTIRNFQWAIEQMRRLDSSSAQYHTAVGWLEYLNWNWNSAISHYELALKANPKFVRAHGVYAGVTLRARGDYETSLREFKAAEQLDPRDSIIQIHLGTPYYFRRDYTNAIAQFQKASLLERSAAYSLWWLALSYEGNRQYREALASYEANEKLWPGSDISEVEARYQRWRRTLSEKGIDGLWHAMLDHRQKTRPDNYAIAGFYARLGDEQNALDFLEKAFQEHHENMPDLLLHHFWDAFRDEPRFKNIVTKMRFSIQISGRRSGQRPRAKVD